MWVATTTKREPCACCDRTIPADTRVVVDGATEPFAYFCLKCMTPPPPRKETT